MAEKEGKEEKPSGSGSARQTTDNQVFFCCGCGYSVNSGFPRRMNAQVSLLFSCQGYLRQAAGNPKVTYVMLGCLPLTCVSFACVGRRGFKGEVQMSDKMRNESGHAGQSSLSLPRYPGAVRPKNNTMKMRKHHFSPCNPDRTSQHGCIMLLERLWLLSRWEKSDRS